MGDLVGADTVGAVAAGATAADLAAHYAVLAEDVRARTEQLGHACVELPVVSGYHAHGELQARVLAELAAGTAALADAVRTATDAVIATDRRGAFDYLTVVAG